MELSDYLARIGYEDSLAPDLQTLSTLHAAHLRGISYENLDIHLGHPVTLDMNQIFEKVVHKGRGGWCFEMSGLFAWALREIGFDVTMLAATVGRSVKKTVCEGDHLILMVNLEQPHLADVGFGNAFVYPIPLKVGSYGQDFRTMKLEQEQDRWIFQNETELGPGFDFTLKPRKLEDFSDPCQWLQTSSDSGFVQVTVCHRMTDDETVTLRGAILARTTKQGTARSEVNDKHHYAATLTNTFGLNLSDDQIEALWSKVWPSHQSWIQANPTALDDG